MRYLAATDPVAVDPHRGSRRHRDAGRISRSSEAPHRLEQIVRRLLLSHPNLRFSSLVIRRIPNGVCLEGVLENDDNLDICGLARSVDGVDEVRNRLVVRKSAGE